MVNFLSKDELNTFESLKAVVLHLGLFAALGCLAVSGDS